MAGWRGLAGLSVGLAVLQVLGCLPQPLREVISFELQWSLNQTIFDMADAVVSNLLNL